MPCKVIVTLKTGGTEEFVYDADDIVGALEEYENDSAAQASRQNAEKVEFQIIPE